MEKCILAGSPNWYLSQVLDISSDSRVAYGSLSSLVILDPSHILNPVTINHAHSSKVLSVSFPPHGFGNKLLSTSESGEAFVWDLNSRKIAQFYKHPQKCAILGNWSPVDGNLIVLADENGNLLQWKIEPNKTSIKQFKEHAFTVVSCSPHDQTLVATGTKKGLVCVVNIKVPGKEFILHKLRGHDTDVVSLSWCPVKENVINSKNDQDSMLLASGAKEKRIYFWRAGQDGLYETYVDVPFAPRTQAAMKQWTCVSWFEPQKLLVSTVVGEVLSIDVSKLKSKKVTEKVPKWEHFSDSHNRCHVIVKSSLWQMMNGAGEEDWRNKEAVPHWVWTFGADRLISGVSCSEKRFSPIKVNTIGGPVHAMSISSIDGTSLAIGVADKSIRVINLIEPQLKTMQTFNQKVSGKVMSLSWHPSKDGWLAYGTSDGRIGIQFTCSVKPPLLFRPFTKESIYSMEWGPSLASIKVKFEPSEYSEEGATEVKASRYVLYAIGGGKIAAMDPSKPDQVFDEVFKGVLKSIPKIENLKSKSKTVGLTDLSWKPDYSLLALGDETGSIHLIKLDESDELVLVTSVKVHSSLVQDLSWHPQCCSSDTSDVSPQSNWLATASNDVNICILDVTSVLEGKLGESDNNSLPSALSNVPCIATLKGHKLRVSKLAWSPHEGGRLLSVSYDQCAQVWDVINRKPIACYTLHSAPLFCCVWSPFNSSLAITAGMEGSVNVWDVLDQEIKLPIAKSKDGPNLLDEAKEASSSFSNLVNGVNSSINGDSEPTKPKNKTKKEKAILSLSGPDMQNEDSNIAILKFLLHPTADNSDLKFTMSDDENHKRKLPTHYAFFADQSAVDQYLLKETKSVANNELSFTLNVWRGSPKDAIAEAIRTRTVNSYIISIAPSVSHKMWVEACAVYADQLKEVQEFDKASVYLLAIHKYEEAVRLLAENGKYRHALAIARCRLPAESPLVQTLLTEWAQRSLNNGQQSLAAVCFASGGEWTKAAECLALKKIPSRLVLAAQIMKEKSPEQTNGIFYARECFDLSLCQQDWTAAQTILNLYPTLNHQALRLFMHQMLYSSKDSLSPIDWLNLKNTSGLETKEDDVHVAICLSKDKVLALENDFVNEITVNNEETAWLAASRKLTQAYLAAPDLFPQIKERFLIEDILDKGQNLQSAYRHLVQAMALLYHFHITSMKNESGVPIFLRVCMWLAPRGPLQNDSMFASPSSSLQSSLRAYLAAGLLFWMLKWNTTDECKRAQVLATVESLKNDIFSVDSLKSFKVEFKLKFLQECKVNRLLKEKQVTKPEGTLDSPENVHTQTSNDFQDETLPVHTTQKAAIGDLSQTDLTEPENTATRNMESVTGNQGVILPCADQNADADELDELSNWIEEFTVRREKVPNPYLSYSNLIQVLNINKTDKSCNEMLEKYSAFWEQCNSLLDV